MHTTSFTLLERLRTPGGHLTAWERFVRIYTPLLFHWCRRAGLDSADAADLVQEVFAKLVLKLPTFEYDRHRGFRNWLRTLTLNKWRDWRRRNARRPVALADLTHVPDEADSSFEKQTYRRELVARAMELVRPEFLPTTWRAFVEHGVNSRPAADVAREIGITVGAVYAARCRVLARLRSELSGLLEEA